ncbi:MAG: hypothetical protein M3463_20850 [Verrucomicrobiota bacterium]|nr:hypothetical protein [Verrucomicrobiota bacterium]
MIGANRGENILEAIRIQIRELEKHHFASERAERVLFPGLRLGVPGTGVLEPEAAATRAFSRSL